MPKLLQTSNNMQTLLQPKNETDKSLDIYIYGDIVSNEWMAYNEDQYPDAIKTFLVEANGRDINVHINSGGGAVFAGIAIYNMLKNYDGNVTTYVDGVAASIASVIALAGDKTIMRPGSALMIHKPMYCLLGMYNSEELQKAAIDLDEVQKCIMDVYAKNITEKTTLKEVEAMVNKETWLPFEEATKIFNIEADEEELQAVACTSDYITKFAGGIPPQYAQEKTPKNGVDIKQKMHNEYEILNLTGGKNEF